jgi:hypothetical protein
MDDDELVMLTVRIPKSRMDELNQTAREFKIDRSALIRMRLDCRLSDIGKVDDVDWGRRTLPQLVAQTEEIDSTEG